MTATLMYFVLGIASNVMGSIGSPSSVWLFTQIPAPPLNLKRFVRRRLLRVNLDFCDRLLLDCDLDRTIFFIKEK